MNGVMNAAFAGDFIRAGREGTAVVPNLQTYGWLQEFQSTTNRTTIQGLTSPEASASLK